MIETLISNPLRRLATAALVLAACLAPAAQQPPVPYPGSPPSPGAPARNPSCIRLAAQLGALDRGTYDPARADQIKRLEDTARGQQIDLDRITAQGRRMGCEGRGFFSLFSGQPPQCGPLNNQIQQARANLDRVLGDLERLQGNSADREGQRRSILAALGQSDCGPQYRAFANRTGGGGFFDGLFGNGTIISNPEVPAGSGNTYRTLCVRTCDGYYFPISYSTVPGKFAEDEALCRRLCPATEVALYSHRNPGEDIARAVSLNGRAYSDLPTAFSYRKVFNAACSCRAPGQSWEEALRQGEDQTLERGDIVVTEERSRQM